MGRPAATAQATAPLTGADPASTTRCVHAASHRSTHEKVSSAAVAAARVIVAGMQHTNGSHTTLRPVNGGIESQQKHRQQLRQYWMY